MIDKIHQFLINEELPGFESHLKMSPQGRVNPAFKIPDSARKSAVLILLHQYSNTTHCTLIQRPAYEGTHSAQVSFPGGKIEKGESLKETALRETHEEIGIHSDLIEVIGELTEIYIPPSNFLVSPFVGKIDTIPEYVPDKREVAEVFTFDINILNNDSIVKRTRLKTGNGQYINVPYFDIQDKVVWGATAAILNEMKTILSSI